MLQCFETAIHNFPFSLQIQICGIFVDPTVVANLVPFVRDPFHKIWPRPRRMAGNEEGPSGLVLAQQFQDAI